MVCGVCGEFGRLLCCDEVHTGASTDDSAMCGIMEFHWTPILCVEHWSYSCEDNVDECSMLTGCGPGSADDV